MSTLNKLDITPELLINRSTLIFGTSSTGKTVLIRDILYTLKDHVPMCHVFCPTNDYNEAYTNMVPKNLIKKELVVSELEELVKKQRGRSELYKKVNNINSLKNIAFKLDLDHKIKKKFFIVENYYENLLKNDKDNKYTDELKKLHEEQVIGFFKEEIMKVYDQNKNLVELTEVEINTVKYLNFNPKMVIVLDDCTSDAKQWGKSTVLNELFFQGRHYNITTIISLHNDTALPPAIRKNSFINIFTEAGPAIGFFKSGTSNNFTKAEEREANSYANALFGMNAKKSFKKLCYLREYPSGERFKFVRATKRSDFVYNELLFKIYKEDIETKTEIDNEFLKKILTA